MKAPLRGLDDIAPGTTSAPSPASTSTSDRICLVVAFVVSAFAAAWVYRPSVDSYLVTDDFQWIEGGMTATISRVLSVADRVHFYRPAIETYFAGMHAAFGCSARALHVASVLAHLVNVGLVIVLARQLVHRWMFAALAGLLFAVQPAPAEAVLWPSAITMSLCATFGLSFLILDVRCSASAKAWGDRSRTGGCGAWAAVMFAGALACHESAVAFVPAALLLRIGIGERKPLASWIRDYIPCLVLLALYLPLTAWINHRNYVITDRHYTIGAHIGQNFLDYLVSLYVGQRRMADYVLVSLVWVALLWRGSPLVGSLCLWIILSLLPVLPFAFGTASRFLYVATIPFCLLLALGIVRAHDALAQRLPQRRAIAAGFAALLTLFIVGRSASIARQAATAFQSTAEPYRVVAEQVRRDATNGTVRIDQNAASWIPPLYVTALARTAVCDPDLVVR